MNSTQPPSAPVKIDIGLGLAARAWDDFCRRSGTRGRPPAAMTSLKSQRALSKSGVYRLEAAAADGSAVVAKRCRRSTAWVEREVYERVLPHLTVSRLRYHGYAEEADGDFCWLFLEDAGRAKLLESDRALAAAWVARLHTEAARWADTVALPERGPTYYREHLQVARALIDGLSSAARGSSNPPVEAEAETLRRLHALLDELEARWHTICAPCGAAPRTLIHGDFGKKNLRTRTTETGTALLVLDWETAGWGPVGADLPQLQVRRPRPQKRDKPPRWRGTVPLDVYAAHASGAWDGVKARELARLAAIGTVFRLVSSIRWAADQVLGVEPIKPLAKLRLYADELPHLIASAEG